MNRIRLIIGIALTVVLVTAIVGIYRSESKRMADLRSEPVLAFHEMDQYSKRVYLQDTIVKILESADSITENQRFLISSERLWGNTLERQDYSKFDILKSQEQSDSPYRVQYGRLELSSASKYLKPDIRYGYPKAYYVRFDCDSQGTLRNGSSVIEFANAERREPLNFSIPSTYANWDRIEKRQNEVEQKRIEEKQRRQAEREREWQKALQEEEKRQKMAENYFKFKSTFNDLENEYGIIRTEYETTYHTFDFNQMQVEQVSQNSSGEWMSFTFPMKSFYQDGTTYVIVVDYQGITEIWFNPLVNNLGYDFYNGQRIAYYGVEPIE